MFLMESMPYASDKLIFLISLSIIQLNFRLKGNYNNNKATDIILSQQCWDVKLRIVDNKMM